MITFGYSSSDIDLKQILELQKRNLSNSLSPQEIKSEGFVTLNHSFDLLKELAQPFPHTIAKYNDNVIAYALSMPKSCRDKIDILKPMFAGIDTCSYDGILLKDVDYMVMGQVCVDKEFRKKGIFRKLYAKMADQLKYKMNHIITEVSAMNQRSLQAHKAVGFEELLCHEENGENWITIILPLNK